MTTIKLHNVGNLPADDILPRFRVVYRGLIAEPKGSPHIVLKDYGLAEDGRTLLKTIPSLAEDERFLIGEIEQGKGRVEMELGLGWVVFSKNAINCSIWRRDFPHAPRQTIWNREGRLWVRADMNRDNSYCIGEGEIYAHERTAWQRFLNDGNKEKYVTDMLGILE